jgi:hypothetical protein
MMPAPALLFVHGLDQGEGSPLEAAVRHEARRQGAGFHVLRWEAGVPPVTLTGAAVLGALGACFEGPRLSVEGIFRGATHAATGYFRAAEANVEEAAERCLALLRLLDRDGPVVVLGYSLGADVVRRALATPDSDRGTRHLTRVVLAAGTCDPRLLRSMRVWIQGRALERGRLVNVWSKTDGVLLLLRRMAHRAVAGLGPVRGAVNVQTNMGHEGYVRLASVLVALACEGPEVVLPPVRRRRRS